jgi:hypothetical protein
MMKNLEKDIIVNMNQNKKITEKENQRITNVPVAQL